MTKTSYSVGFHDLINMVTNDLLHSNSCDVLIKCYEFNLFFADDITGPTFNTTEVSGRALWQNISRK